MKIRDERPGDEPAIFAVNEAAFAQPAPPEAFMAMELVPGGLDGAGATVRYHAAFRAF